MEAVPKNLSNGEASPPNGNAGPPNGRWFEGGIFESALEATGEAFVAIDAEGRITAWNKAASEIFGYQREEALGAPLVTLILPERYRTAHSEGIKRVLAGGSPAVIGRRVEVEGLHRDGHEVPVELSVSEIEVGGVKGFVAFLHDITDRRRTEVQLKEERQRFKRSFEAAPIGMALVSPGGDFLEVNPALCGLLGRSAEDLKSTGFQPLTHPDDLDRDLDHLQRTLVGEIDGYEIEKRYLRPDGSTVWAQLHVSLLRDEDGEPVHFVSQIADVTERKNAEQELQRYNQELRDAALSDPVSGLASYDAFEIELRSRLGSEDPLVVALLELDVAVANRVELQGLLREVGHRLEGDLRDEDFGARAGDSRFILLLDGSDDEQGRGVVERLCGGLCEAIDELSKIRWGVAAYPTAGRDAELLVRRAEVDLRRRSRGASSEMAPADRELPVELRTRIKWLLRMAREHLGMDIAFLGEFSGDSEVFRAVEGDARGLGLEEGSELDLDGSYCQRMDDGRIANIVRDSSEEPQVAHLAVTREADIGSYLGVPLRMGEDGFQGALCVASHGARPDLGERELELMEFIAELVGDLFARHQAETASRRGELIDSGIAALLSALAARDHYTGEHSDAVVALAGEVARRLGLEETYAAEVEQVALLHDIGKVGIPDAVLQKEAPLNQLEWELMRQHPVIGERIVASVDALAPLAPAVRAEHERFDGDGYPDGLRGNSIPLASRITLACDAYHAMVSDRPYRAAMSEAEAISELREGSGSQFDPRVVEALVSGYLEGGRPSVGLADADPVKGLREAPLPEWEALEGLAMARLRCVGCGAHVMASVGAAVEGGCCSNCGGCELETLTSDSKAPPSHEGTPDGAGSDAEGGSQPTSFSTR